MKKSRAIVLCIFWALLLIVLVLRLFTSWIPDTVNAAVSMISFLVFGIVEFWSGGRTGAKSRWC